MSKKILLFDIETASNIAYVWGKWEQNVIAYQKEWYMLSFSAKWLGEKKYITKGLCDYKSFKKDRTDDKELVKDLWELFNEADIIIAHNGDSFDIKKSNARFAYHKLNPPAPYKTVDTKKVAKKYFSFNSNSLTDLGEHFKLGKKLETGGFDLWLGCMAGDKKSWKTMLDYNKQDVVLLEKVYLKLRNWMTNHPRLEENKEGEYICSVCGGKHMQKRGFGITRTSRYQRLQCQSCGAWDRGDTIKKKKNEVIK